jgi:hypothetical protein
MAPTSRTKPPRGGLWKYVHPISGTQFSSHQLGAIKYSIWKHEESNGYPQTAEADIESQLCQNHPFSCSDNPPVVSGRRLHVSDIVRGTRVIASFKLAGSPLVPHEEAERRAGICVNCSHNVDYAKPCSGLCQELIEIVNAVVGGAATKYDSMLKACDICGCANSAQVHVPAEFLAKGVSPEMLAEFKTVEQCWKWRAVEAL